MIYREASSELKQVPIAGEYVGTWWMWLHDSCDRYHRSCVHHFARLARAFFVYCLLMAT
nr:MAG TPA: hypothetical protein [Caudoviricetes sp.]